MSRPHPERVWVAEHGAALVGMQVDDASHVVEKAGFRAWVYVEEPNSAMVLSYNFGVIRLIAEDGRVSDVHAG